MRVPPHFRPRDPDEVWDVVRRHPFGTLVTARPGEAPTGSPLPFLARPHDGPRGAVIGHIARDNAQLAALEVADARVLVIFQGPCAYVSGAYYDEQPAVPTINHITVHLTGAPCVLAPHATLAVLEETVAHFEARAGSSWRIDAAHPYVRDLARQVAAFRVDVEQVEASFKLSQNVDEHARALVAAGLLADGHEEVVTAMRRQGARGRE